MLQRCTWLWRWLGKVRGLVAVGLQNSSHVLEAYNGPWSTLGRDAPKTPTLVLGVLLGLASLLPGLQCTQWYGIRWVAEGPSNERGALSTPHPTLFPASPARWRAIARSTCETHACVIGVLHCCVRSGSFSKQTAESEADSSI